MNFKIINVLIFQKESVFFLRVSLRRQENALLQKGNLACSMIMISENATPLILLRLWILSAIVRNKTTRIFIPKTTVICDTSTISVNVRVLLKEVILKMVLNILTCCLVVKSLVWLQTLQIKVYPKFLNYKIIQSTKAI